VSKQIAHADVAVTAKRYAKWCDDHAYREPMQLGAGEVPTDYLARLVELPENNPSLTRPPAATGAASGYVESRNLASGIIVSAEL
jgi:hypothetical protein